MKLEHLPCVKKRRERGSLRSHGIGAEGCGFLGSRGSDSVPVRIPIFTDAIPLPGCWPQVWMPISRLYSGPGHMPSLPQ